MATRRDDSGGGRQPLAAGAAETECDPPFTITEPGVADGCMVLSSPHSGSVYPAAFLQSARLDPFSLRRSEDAFVDRLFAPAAAAHGAPLLHAHFPRAFIDANREPYELDPRMFEGRLPAFVNSRSVRVAGGLGTIARVVGEAQEIYARRLTVEEGIGRIERFYKPYHAALRGLLDRAIARAGQAVLVDCHSMPSHGALAAGGPCRLEERLKADFVIGDRFGTSCHPLIAVVVEEALAGFGYAVERNKPYAGGFITEHYGRPSAGRHALQIEVNRALYMDERTIRPLPGFETVAAHLTGALGALAALMERPLDRDAIAAE